VKGGFNVAAMFGMLQEADSSAYVNFNELTHSFPLEFISDTIYWNFKYIASDSIGIDNIYSVANSTNGDGNPQVGDEWNFGENFVVNIVEEIIPVEFTSFTASQEDSKVFLSWSTATETNNLGFEVENTAPLKPPNGVKIEEWETIGFVKGNGTTTNYNEYSFIDNITKSGIYRYRLKQIDFDGKYQYSKVINIDVTVSDFTLDQNYPNPFNPSTKIKFTIPTSPLNPSPYQGEGSRERLITLKVYDVLGTEIVTLVNEYKPAGSYEVEFSSGLIHQTIGGVLRSGVYFYQLRAGDFSNTKKMLMIK
jgi:hypothetical protein